MRANLPPMSSSTRRQSGLSHESGELRMSSLLHADATHFLCTAAPILVRMRPRARLHAPPTKATHRARKRRRRRQAESTASYKCDPYARAKDRGGYLCDFRLELPGLPVNSRVKELEIAGAILASRYTLRGELDVGAVEDALHQLDCITSRRPSARCNRHRHCLTRGTHGAEAGDGGQQDGTARATHRSPRDGSTGAVCAAAC
jgi:hypothetical protein